MKGLSSSPLSRRRGAGFTLMEAVFTIAIIGIMSSIVIASISSASRDANRILARQQQATLQSALDAWAMGQMRNEADGQVIGVEALRTTYNGAANTLARFRLLAPDAGDGYLDEGTRQHFIDHSPNGDRLESAALNAAKQHITLPVWQLGGFPQALLQDNL